MIDPLARIHRAFVPIQIRSFSDANKTLLLFALQTNLFLNSPPTEGVLPPVNFEVILHVISADLMSGILTMNVSGEQSGQLHLRRFITFRR